MSSLVTLKRKTMTKNIIHFNDHKPRGKPFNNGYDPRRNTLGAPKGKNFRHAFGQEMFEKHREELEEVVAKVIQRAIWGHDQSQKLCFDYFITKPVADITANTTEYNDVLEDMVNIPKEELESMRSKFVDVLSKYSNDDNKGDE